MSSQTPDLAGASTFVVLVNGTRVGTETADFSRLGSGWKLSSSGRLQAPFDLITNEFQVSYSVDWQPQRLDVDAMLHGQPLLLSTTFGPQTATSSLTQGTQHGNNTQPVSPRAVVLVGNVFSAYEALAVRVASSAVGARVPVYIAPNGETTATIDAVTSRRVSVGDRVTDLQAYRVTVASGAGAVPVDLWVDGRGRMARLSLPAAGVVVIRDDLASVMARVEPAHNPGDEEVFIGANGFTLGTTVTKPAGTSGPAAAAVLVAGSGPQDRDYTTFGIPIFAQIAGGLASHGVLAVRYDVRGVGRSGGRTETSRLDEYSEDAAAIVTWLRRRKDVDDKRIVLVGYADAAPVALMTASRDKRIAGVVLVGASGHTGREITLEKQQRVLESLGLPDTDRAERIKLETRVIDAVTSGQGWEALPADVREQADTLWFKSWLEFDPAAVIRKLAQPLLIVQGSRDREVPAAEGAQLAELSASRAKLPPAATRTVTIDGVNHLFVPAATGAMDEYDVLEARAVSPALASAVADWVKGIK